jgi:hypothetical protein
MTKDPQYVVYVADTPKIIHLATKIKFVGIIKCINLASQTGKQCNLRVVGEETHCFEAMPPPDFPRLSLI